MDVVLTEHARKRLLKRKIQLNWVQQAIDYHWVQQAIDYPIRTQSDDEDPQLVHALWAVPERGFRVLRVIYNEAVDPVAVVTAYFEDEVVVP